MILHVAGYGVYGVVAQICLKLVQAISAPPQRHYPVPLLREHFYAGLTYP
jgi:hypothetical protein